MLAAIDDAEKVRGRLRWWMYGCMDPHEYDGRAFIEGLTVLLEKGDAAAVKILPLLLVLAAIFFLHSHGARRLFPEFAAAAVKHVKDVGTVREYGRMLFVLLPSKVDAEEILTTLAALPQTCGRPSSPSSPARRLSSCGAAWR